MEAGRRRRQVGRASARCLRGKRRQSFKIDRHRSPANSRRLIGRRGDRNVRAIARFLVSERLDDWLNQSIVSVGDTRQTAMPRAVLVASVAAGSAGRLARCAGVRTRIDAVGAVAADAQIDRTAAPREELRRHEH